MRATDPRIVALYDLDNPGGVDHDYYRSLAQRPGVHQVVDLGCGTGLLTVTLTAHDRAVTGIDPDRGMLEHARRRPGAERVRWVLGDSSSIEAPADLVVMTGNVAQHIVGEAWGRTLGHIAAALRPGGLVAFESRHPAAQVWRTWDRDHSYGTRQTAAGPLTEWLEITGIDDAGTVTFDAYNVFHETGEQLVYTDSLAFRDPDQLRTDLAAAGLAVQHLWGGWHRERLSDSSPVIVVEGIGNSVDAGRGAA